MLTKINLNKHFFLKKGAINRHIFLSWKTSKHFKIFTVIKCKLSVLESESFHHPLHMSILEVESGNLTLRGFPALEDRE